MYLLVLHRGPLVHLRLVPLHAHHLFHHAHLLYYHHLQNLQKVIVGTRYFNNIGLTEHTRINLYLQTSLDTQKYLHAN